MSLLEHENKLGSRTNTKNLLTGSHDIYRNGAVVLSSLPISSREIEGVFGMTVYKNILIIVIKLKVL
ncbi:hypothetical protein [Staphylococcus felis]|uniref:hypothetical protein n=1 Tax=Staphylococcus felis TaxID=46127 RepID=UPI000CD1F5B9|nr:hypothetical protein [Staphylococcus felis]AVP36286.1 hypothetical protein C7J90_04715 [Staphylococcus felis]PNZ34373.1 hypothetical protein CD143_09215 [Staphylococcus felis]